MPIQLLRTPVDFSPRRTLPPAGTALIPLAAEVVIRIDHPTRMLRCNLPSRRLLVASPPPTEVAAGSTVLPALLLLSGVLSWPVRTCHRY